mmetsp:Transcript_6752/g.16101  ORF Transcript_6752/g.16101 Transcript_6752/m.16101 type:complete len:211 (+) Transcript_6752:364-996(+)
MPGVEEVASGAPIDHEVPASRAVTARLGAERMSWHRLVGQVLTLVIELACVVAAVGLEVPAVRAVPAGPGAEHRIRCAGPAPSSAVRFDTANAADAGAVIISIGNAASMTAIGLVVGDGGVGSVCGVGVVAGTRRSMECLESELEVVVRVNDVSHLRRRLCEGTHRLCSERLLKALPFVMTTRELGQLDRVHDGKEAQRVHKVVVLLLVR